jgi:hypothetical protein
MCETENFTTADNQLRSICKYHNIKYDMRLSECFLFNNISPFSVGGNILWFPRNVFIGMTRASFAHVNRRYQYPGSIQWLLPGQLSFPGSCDQGLRDETGVLLDGCLYSQVLEESCTWIMSS